MRKVSENWIGTEETSTRDQNVNIQRTMDAVEMFGAHGALYYAI